MEQFKTMDKIKKTKNGKIITILDFLVLDKQYNNPDYVDKIMVDADGCVLDAYYGGFTKCWENIKEGSGEIFERPVIKTTISDYYLELIEEAREKNESVELINWLMTNYNRELRYETEEPKEEKNIKTYVPKVWNY